MAQIVLRGGTVAKGFERYGGVLINIRVHPKVRAEFRYAAKQLGVSAADLYREACELWLQQWRQAQSEAEAAE